MLSIKRIGFFSHQVSLYMLTDTALTGTNKQEWWPRLNQFIHDFAYIDESKHCRATILIEAFEFC